MIIVYQPSLKPILSWEYMMLDIILSIQWLSSTICYPNVTNSLDKARLEACEGTHERTYEGAFASDNSLSNTWRMRHQSVRNVGLSIPKGANLLL